MRRDPAELLRPILACALLVQPLTILAQVLAAPHWRGDFSLVHNTISDLGTARSSWHVLVNGSFVVLGAALVVAGALLLRHRGAVRAGGALLILAGVGSVLVGIVPVDQNGGLHTLVATPVFLTQPIAVLLVAAGLRRPRRLRLVVGLLGLLAAVGVVAFGLSIATGGPGGLQERLALWSCHLAWGVLGIAMLREARLPLLE